MVELTAVCDLTHIYSSMIDLIVCLCFSVVLALHRLTYALPAATMAATGSPTTLSVWEPCLSVYQRRPGTTGRVLQDLARGNWVEQDNIKVRNTIMEPCCDTLV